MARVPDIIRRNPISTVAPTPPRTGAAWEALAGLAKMGADALEPAAVEKAQEQGYDAVYRDADGTLKVDKKTPAGILTEAHNATAYAKFLSGRQIDMAQTFTDLSQKHEFDPAGFKGDADTYISLLEKDDTIPRPLKEQLIAEARKESNARFNGLQRAEVVRTQKDADTNTKTRRDMLADDYVNLYMAGDEKGAADKLAEIESISTYRGSEPSIGETPAEREAYMKGLRGSAKVARLTQRLSETEGQSGLSDAQRKEFDDILRDPDVDPDSRRKLYVAVQGRLKGIDAAAAVDGLTSDSYESKVVRAEGGGNPQAKNPKSSAFGDHQFIASTWLDNVAELRRQGGAKWAEGMSTDDILRMRGNSAASSEVFQHFRSKNAQVLSRNGLAVTDGTEYMAHFFGAGDAVKVLKADPNTPVSEIVSADKIAANPFLANMTARDAVNWANRKMTVKASDMAAQQRQIDLISDTEVRGMASRLLGERMANRSRIESAEAAGYSQRVDTGDTTLTEQEIMENNNLSDQAQGTLISELRNRRKKDAELQQVVASLNDPAADWTGAMYDTKTRDAVDDVFKAGIGDSAPVSPQGQQLAAEITQRTGFMPATMFKALRGAVMSSDPAQAAGAFEYLGQTLQRFPNAVSAYDGSGDLQGRLSDYSFYSGFMGAEEAAARVNEENSPEAIAKRKNLSDAAKIAAKDLTPKDVTSYFGDLGRDVEIPKDQEGAVMADYDRLFRSEFSKIGSSDLAKRRALDEISRVYGPEQVTGSNRLMKYPPQLFFQMTPQDMQEQIVGDVAQEVGMAPAQSTFSIGGVVQGMALDKNVLRASDLTIMSDERTRTEVSSGKAPSYTVYYKDGDGNLQQMAKRYTFAPTPGDKAAFDEGRNKAMYEANINAWVGYFRQQADRSLTLPQIMEKIAGNRDYYAKNPPPGE